MVEVVDVLLRIRCWFATVEVHLILDDFVAEYLIVVCSFGLLALAYSSQSLFILAEGCDDALGASSHVMEVKGS